MRSRKVKSAHLRGSTSAVVSIEQVRVQFAEAHQTLTIGVPSYNEGEVVVAALTSLWKGLQTLHINDATLFLSDSSANNETVQAAERWAASTGCKLLVNHSDERRTLKAALNVILDNCKSDLLIVASADVTVPESSLAALIGSLITDPFPDVVMGVTVPDPSVVGLRYKAGAFQLRASRRWVMLSSQPSEIKADGALWAAGRKPIEDFRFSVGSGNIADDVELSQAVLAGYYSGLRATDALVCKIPAGTVRDFCLQTRRSFYALSVVEPNRRRTSLEWKAFVLEGSRDPIGAILYAGYRFYAALFASRFIASSHTEYWEVSSSTRRLER